jgi:hypothetical protein
MKMVLALTSLLALAVLTTDAKAATFPRDSTGDSMQRYESRMPSSPIAPGLFGTSYGPLYGPFLPPRPTPLTTITNILVVPEASPTPTPTKASPHAKFWIAHCGSYVEIDVDSTTNLSEEEGKTCQK